MWVMFWSKLLYWWRTKRGLAADLAAAEKMADERLGLLVQERIRLITQAETSQRHEQSAVEAERKELEGAERYIRVLQQEKVEIQGRYDNLRELHSDRVRICSLVVDPARLTAKLRVIEPTLRAEWDGDKVVVYSDVTLPRPKMNAVLAMLEGQVDLT